MPRSSSDRLRLVLQANAAFSAAGGLIALVAGAWVSERLGIDHVVLTRLLGAGLLAFAADVWRVSRLAEPKLFGGALQVSLADAAWVIGTVVVLATGILSTAGTVVAVVVGLAVADFGTAQWILRSRSRSGADATTDADEPAPALA